MLAKENKIKTILKQRLFIKDQISRLSTCEDGNPSYTYDGYVYKENIEYFEKIGYKVVPVESDMLKAILKGRPVYLFTPDEDGINDLNEQEMKDEDYE